MVMNQIEMNSAPAYKFSVVSRGPGRYWPLKSGRFFAVLVLLASLAGCSGQAVRDGVAGDIAIQDAGPLGARGEAVLQVLSAEIAARRRDFAEAAKRYARAAQLDPDPEVAQRAVRFALLSENDELALQAANRWAELSPNAPSPRLALVRLHLRSGNVEQAQSESRMYLAWAESGAGEAFDILSASLLDAQNKQVAADLISAVSKHYPEVPEAYYATALLNLEADRTNPALQAIRQATALRPEWVEARILQSRIALRAGSEQEALRSIQELITQQPDNNAVRLNLARMLIELDRRDEAKHEFETVLARSGEQPDALFILGLMALEDENLEQANRKFVKLVQTGQRSNDAAFYLGVIAEERGKRDEAVGWFRQVGQGERALTAQVRVATLLNELGRTEQALNHLREIRSRNAALAPPLLQAEGNMLLTNGDYKAALAVFDEAVALDPSSADVLYSRSLAREKAGDQNGAMDDLRKIIQTDPDNAQALNALGYMLTNNSRRYKEARGYIEKALVTQPDEPAILDSYGWVLYRLGEYSQALVQLRRAYREFPDPEVAAHLGEVLFVQGNVKEARDVWREALPESDKAKPNPVLLETLRRLAPDLLPANNQ